MRTISVINLKGGVAKTISSTSMAYILAAEYGYRVLLIDNDKQGDSSRGMNVRTESGPGIDKILTEEDVQTYKYIKETAINGLDIIPANMNLLLANQQVMLDQTRMQQNRIKLALDQVKDDYDFCIIDNAPDINVSVINSLVAANDVLIPIKIDDNSTEGMTIIRKQIESARKNFNPDMENVMCFITMYDRWDNAHAQGEQMLRSQNHEMMQTKIRLSRKVNESTFMRGPVPQYSPRSAAAIDYRYLVEEYLKKVSKVDTKKGGE